jgi:predicted Zn-dependent protease
MRVRFAQNRFRYLLVIAAIASVCAFAVYGFYRTRIAEHAPEDFTEDPQARRQTRRAASAVNPIDAQIEAALYARAEFFGASAFVPYPTKEARARLISVRDKYPNEAQIHLKLAALDEQLNLIDEAAQEMNRYVETSKDKRAALEKLAEFYHARARFADEAATIERLISVSPADARAALVRRLLETAQIHKLDAYLAPGYYEKIIAANPNVFEVFSDYIEKLEGEKQRARALDAVRRYRRRFPEHEFYFLDKETSLLAALGHAGEAERVWIENFDPFWSREVSEKFYDFLRAQDRYRAYGAELQQQFERDPTNVQTALRLLHFNTSAGEDSSAVIARLEKARAARNVKWTPKELAQIARILIAENDGDNASRFLYTLYARGEMQPGSELRAQILYQLFEVLTDAQGARIALTRGDLKFYEEVATADTQPGMLGGVLSLIFSDAKAGREFRNEETLAVKHFNRAAAYRIFLLYKNEQPTSPQLAQMYLDIVRLYTATDERDVAARTLEEFAARYTDAPQFAEVALKLADAYLAAGKHREEQEIYARILDYLGRRASVSNAPLFDASDAAKNKTGAARPRQNIEAKANNEDEASPPARNAQRTPRSSTSGSADLTAVKPSLSEYPPKSNAGVNIPSIQEEAATESNSIYHDYMTLVEERDANSANALRRDANKPRVTYGEVLARYVASLAAENRTSDILAVYSGEIKKHPRESRLYEEMLEWLGQTNLVGEQLRVYREALRQFSTTSWRDRLARYFLRRERKREFSAFATQLLSKLDEDEVSDFLNKFARDKSDAASEDETSDEADAVNNADETNFDALLSLALYSQAHARFPHNMNFVEGLLGIYAARKQWAQWRKLAAQYYFESKTIRQQFLANLAEHDELRAQFAAAQKRLANQNSDDLNALPYKLFRADAAVWLSRYEDAIDAYRELQRLYPNAPEFADRLVAFTRSFGERNARLLAEAARVSRSLADAHPANAAYRTQAGEIEAELGDYAQAKTEWEKLIALAPGDAETYLDTATLYWDYFQYADALRTIYALRNESGDQTQYAYQAGAILEAQHKRAEAIGEYVKAMDEHATETHAARARLIALYKRGDNPALINAAFRRELERRRAARDAEDSRDDFIFAYAEFLRDVGERASATLLLIEAVPQSRSVSFLTRARDLFESQKNTNAAELALRRLIALSDAPRRNILYRLRLAELQANAGRTDEAKQTLAELLKTYPNNYGVLNETASFYWRIGAPSLALDVLRDGMTRGKGRFHYLFARKLAARQIELAQFSDAEKTLSQLNAEDPANLDVFRELARIYARTANRAAFDAVLRRTIAAINAQNIEPINIRAQILEARREAVKTFTLFGDYRSAVAQFIEIINRNPEDETKLNDALRYIARYPESGGADALLAYYQRAAEEASQNYRWNVVLARIYEAKNDDAAAIENYRAALAKQPEKRELYTALAKAYLRVGNHTAAIENLNRAAKLSNDDPRDVRLLIEALEKAGRTAEAAEARKRLPSEADAQKTISDQFAAAARLRANEKAKAAQTYRAAFVALIADPFKHELTFADVSGFVESVRDQENLNAAVQPLWTLRDKLIIESERANSTNAGKARQMLQTLDAAMPETVGRIAAERATGDELETFYRDLRARLDKFKITNDKQNIIPNDSHNTLPLLQTLAHRAGFGALEVEAIARQKDIALALKNMPAYQTQFRALIQFYTERGDYARVVKLIEDERARDRKTEAELLPLLIENARLAGDATKELEALRAYYNVFNNPPHNDSSATANNAARVNARVNLNPSPLASLAAASPAALIARYFEVLYESGDEGRRELHELARSSAAASRYALINFLLAKEERDLAREAIENANRPVVWKRAREAEASYMLRDFDAQSENYFVSALRYKNIREMLARPPDTARELVGNNWFKLSETYGRWLYLAPDAAAHGKSSALLPAMIEARPRDASAQLALGRFYLAQKDAANALKHLTIAAEEEPSNDAAIAALGSALFQRGDATGAEREWNKLIAGDNVSPERATLYLQTLAENNRASVARERLAPVVIKYLKTLDEEDESANDAREKLNEEDVKRLIRRLARSFENKPRLDANKDVDVNAASDARVETNEANKAADEAVKLDDADEQTAAKSLPPAVEAARAAYFERLAAASKRAFLPELIVTESLVGEKARGAFYAMLIARSDKLEPYERDAEFVALGRGSLADDAAREEILDHKTDFNAAEPESEKIKWQRAYIEYLFKRHQTSEARKIIADVETEIKDRYARPAWLRLARIRLALVENQTAAALNQIKHFVGIETAPEVQTLAPPNLKRLNDALAVLRATRHEAETDRLTESFHARRIALAQYETSDFATLARLAAKRDDAKAAAQFLRLMIALGDDATRSAAEAEISALPIIKTFQATAVSVEPPAPSNNVTYLTALRVAAETSVAIKRFGEAIAYRRQSVAVAPDDAANRLELARLLAHENQFSEAVRMLAQVIADRRQTRIARWQAVALAPEIVGNRAELWNALEQAVNASNGVDREMLSAIRASALAFANRSDEAVRVLRDAEASNPNPYLIYFRALLEKTLQRGDWAQTTIAALEASRDERMAKYAEAFGFKYDDPMRQLIRFDAQNNRALAALRLAASNDLRPSPKMKVQTVSDESTEAVETPNDAQTQDENPTPNDKRAASDFLTLRERRAARAAATRVELFSLLSRAAERAGDYALAIAYGRAYLETLSDAAQRRASIARLRLLRARERTRAELQARLFPIDENLVGGASSDE